MLGVGGHVAVSLIVDKILASQAEGDRKFLELEEKRMCLEERERERGKNEKRRKGISAEDDVHDYAGFRSLSLPTIQSANLSTS